MVYQINPQERRKHRSNLDFENSWIANKQCKGAECFGRLMASETMDQDSIVQLAKQVHIAKRIFDILEQKQKKHRSRPRPKDYKMWNILEDETFTKSRSDDSFYYDSSKNLYTFIKSKLLTFY